MLTIICVAGLYSGEAGLLALGLFGLLATGVSWAWSRLGGWRVTVEQRVVPTYAFAGDDVQLTLKIRNRKALPARISIYLPFERWRDDGLSLEQEQTIAMTLPPLSQRRHTLQVKAERRGVYDLALGQFATSDPWGYFIHRKPVHGSAALWVYPRLYDIYGLSLNPAVSPDGSPGRHGMWSNRLYWSGIKGGENRPARDIHWPATARLQQLQYKQYDTSRQAGVFVLLDLEPPRSAADLRRAEQAISLAASLIWQRLQDDEPAGFLTNSGYDRLPAGPSQWRRITNVTTFTQLLRFLAALKLEDGKWHSWDAVLAGQAAPPWGMKPVVVASLGSVSPLLQAYVERYSGAILLVVEDPDTAGAPIMLPGSEPQDYGARQLYACHLAGERFLCSRIASWYRSHPSREVQHLG